MTAGVAIRPGRDSESEALIALIWSCWSLYPGIRMDVDREMPEMRALATWYAQKGGALWVTEAAGHVVGMIATCPLHDGTWEICRVYVDPERHGSGLAHALLDTAEAHAIQSGAQRLELWSDTRFERAHRFYQKRSYVRSGPVRVLRDISNSLEFGYAKPIQGVEVLDAAAAVSAEQRSPAIAGSWRLVASGSAVVLAGWRDGVLAGTATLTLAEPHRGEVVDLSVDPEFRRRGLGRALMTRLEHEAKASGRHLLTAYTLVGEPLERLLDDSGWTALGTIPLYALRPDKSPADARLFWKAL